jgi:SAM-dependent methyltransferase
MQANSDEHKLKDYYARRAHQYERIYAKPERQADLARLRESVPAIFDGRDVLEIACGTGYWTQYVATRAASVLATDVNEEVLELARLKSFPRGNVEFACVDIYSESGLSRQFDAGLGAFWWSHVPRQGQDRFIEHFHRRLHPGAIVVFLDNRYVVGSSTPLTRSDEHGNTFQSRTLDDGSRYEVLKNIPDESELTAALGDRARALESVELD